MISEIRMEKLQALWRPDVEELCSHCVDWCQRCRQDVRSSLSPAGSADGKAA